jgi:hypothetical protein
LHFKKREENGERLVRNDKSKNLSKGYAKYFSKPGDNKIPFSKKPRAFMMHEEYSSDNGDDDDDDDDKSLTKEDEGVATISISTPSTSLFDAPNKNLITKN